MTCLSSDIRVLFFSKKHLCGVWGFMNLKGLGDWAGFSSENWEGEWKWWDVACGRKGDWFKSFLHLGGPAREPERGTHASSRWTWARSTRQLPLDLSEEHTPAPVGPERGVHASSRWTWARSTRQLLLVHLHGWHHPLLLWLLIYHERLENYQVWLSMPYRLNLP